MLVHQNHGARVENGSIMVVVFVCLCLASKKSSEWEFFVPAGTDLGVKLLRVLNGYYESSCSLKSAPANIECHVSNREALHFL